MTQLLLCIILSGIWIVLLLRQHIYRKNLRRRRKEELMEMFYQGRIDTLQRTNDNLQSCLKYELERSNK